METRISSGQDLFQVNTPILYKQHIGGNRDAHDNNEEEDLDNLKWIPGSITNADVTPSSAEESTETSPKKRRIKAEKSASSINLRVSYQVTIQDEYEDADEFVLTVSSAEAALMVYSRLYLNKAMAKDFGKEMDVVF